MGYNLLINGVYWGYNPLTNLLLTSWDIQVGVMVGVSFFQGRIGKDPLLPGTPRPTIYKWLFQLDDSQSLHRKWLEITKHLFINGCLEFQVY